MRDKRQTGGSPGGAILFAAVLVGVGTRSALAEGEAARVVCRFDFDERAAGNLDEIPMYWDALRLSGFPGFAAGRFDQSAGHDAPPSFHLSSAGRNVAYAYAGPDSRVRVGGSYRIDGFIRPDRLRHGRAFLSAHFLDRQGRPILDTTVRSQAIGGGPDPVEWTRVELQLPPAPSPAHAISLVAWVLQEGTWRAEPPGSHPILRSDVEGGAWFDDITIYRLPFAELRSAIAGNVFRPDDRRELEAVLMDPDGGSLAARVLVEDAAGRTALEQSSTVGREVGTAIERISVASLEAGLYHARLEVTVEATVIATRTLDFAVLGETAKGAASAARSFGIVLDPSVGDPTAQLALLERQGVRAVKVPVWGGAKEDTSARVAPVSAEFLQELNRRGFLVTAVLDRPPASADAPDAEPAMSTVTWLSGEATAWREDLAGVAAPFAGVFRWWQVGSDAAADAAPTVDLARAVANVRETLGRFITTPRLATVATLWEDPQGASQPVEQLVVRIGPEADLDWLTAAVPDLRAKGHGHLSGYVEPLGHQFRRETRLAEFAQRVIESRHAGVDTVWVPQTWHLSDDGEAVEPDEEIVLLRTILDVLGDAMPGARLFVAEGVRCLAFDAADRTVLALWDNLAELHGRVHPLPAGRAHKATDLWGREVPLEPDAHGRSTLRLSSTPLLVTGVDEQMVDFAAGVAMTPAHVEAGREIVQHSLELRFAGEGSLRGEGVLQGPASVEITPRAFDFQIARGKTERIDFSVHYPHNEPTGRKTFLAKMHIGPQKEYIEVPLFVELGIADVDAWGTAVVEGNDLVLRHVVSNRSSSVLSFRGSARVPGRERQYRPFANLGSGESQSVEYRFADAASLIGRHVRLILHELNDGPRVHTVELTVP